MAEPLAPLNGELNSCFIVTPICNSMSTDAEEVTCGNLTDGAASSIGRDKIILVPPTGVVSRDALVTAAIGGLTSNGKYKG